MKPAAANRARTSGLRSSSSRPRDQSRVAPGAHNCGAGVDQPPEIVVADISEDAHQDDDVGRHRPGVRVARSGVTGPHRQAGQAGGHRGVASPLGQDRVQLDQHRSHPGGVRSPPQHPDHVPTVAGARTEQPNLTRPLVEGLVEVGLDPAQPPGQAGRRIVIAGVPLLVVLQVRHDRHRRRAALCCNHPVKQAVRPISRVGIALRILVSVLGIGLLLNGSLRMSDDVWPFGPLSQYAFSPPEDATIVITRVEGRLADGRRIDLPLRVGTAGISRAEIEARIPEITADPSLLRAVADGWAARHPAEPPLLQLWLVQDETRLVGGRKGPTRLVELATWAVPR